MTGTDGNSGITWQQFVVIILPLGISFMVGAFLLSEKTESRLRTELSENKAVVREIQKSISVLESRVLSLQISLENLATGGGYKD